MPHIKDDPFFLVITYLNADQLFIKQTSETVYPFCGIFFQYRW
jgi:hypothetical protein